MEPLVQSQNLNVLITTPLEIDFILDQIDVTEAISELYEMVLHVHTTDAELVFDDLLGEMVFVSITTEQVDGSPSDEAPRIFGGIVGRIHQRQTFVDAEGSTIAYYTFYIYPELWRTTLNQDCRIFQEQSVEEMTETLLEEYNVSDVTIDIQDLPNPERLYCVQYNESVYNFLSRLWEEEGLSYFFTHSVNGIALIIINDTLSYSEVIFPEVISLQPYEKSTLALNTIQNITYEKAVIPNQFDTIDYDDENPSKNLNVISPASNDKGGRMFEYPGRFKSLDQGEKLAQMRTEEMTWDSSIMKGQSTVLNFRPHGSFTLENHPRDEWNISYMIYKVVHRLRFHDPEGRNELVYDNTFWAFPNDVPFRPKRKTPKPKIHSHQTALVVGPEGEEVYTDEFGRIKIQFYWDNYHGYDDASSLWVRVAQTWSGPGWGTAIIPRIGMEVVVSFINGDPDQPLVVGCVYNGDNTPPYDVDSPTKSTWKTQSSPRKDNLDRYNELSFEDAMDEEEIFIHAQKDMNVIIKHERTVLIEESDDTLDMVQGSKYLTLYGVGTDHTITQTDGCHRYQIMKGDYNITLGDESVLEAPSDPMQEIKEAKEEAQKAEEEAMAAESKLIVSKKRYDIAQQAVDKAISGSSALKEAALLQAKQKELYQALEAYQASRNIADEKKQALEKISQEHEKERIKTVLNAAKSFQSAAYIAKQKSEIVVLRAHAAEKTFQEMMLAAQTVEQSYHNKPDSSEAASYVAKLTTAQKAMNLAWVAMNNAVIAAKTLQTNHVITVSAVPDGASPALLSIKKTFEGIHSDIDIFCRHNTDLSQSSIENKNNLEKRAASFSSDDLEAFVSLAINCSMQATKIQQRIESAYNLVDQLYKTMIDADAIDEDEEEIDNDEEGITVSKKKPTNHEKLEEADDNQDNAEDDEREEASDEEALPDAISEGRGGDYSLFLEKGDCLTHLLKGDKSITLRQGDYIITLSKGDINIEVSGDINVTATGDIVFEAGGDISLTASGDISMSARGIDMMAKLTIDGMAGLAVSWMAGLAIDGMAGLAVEHMALLMGSLSSLLMVEVGGKSVTKVSGAAVSIAMPG